MDILSYLFDLFVAAYTFDIPATVIIAIIAYWNYQHEKLPLKKILKKEIAGLDLPNSYSMQNLILFLVGVPIIATIIWIISSILGILGYFPDLIGKTFGLLSVLYDTFILFPIHTGITVSCIVLLLILFYRTKKISLMKLCIIVFGLLIFNLILNPILKHNMSTDTQQPTPTLEQKSPQ